jgi:histidyl-tRNA synthetase
MSDIPTAPPSGFRDFLPQACALRAGAVETISRVYRSFGFAQISTSALEDLAVLLGKGGGENEKLIFKVLKRGDKLDAALAAKEEPADMGLRFDLTLPLARFYSKNKGVLPHPFKAFQIGPVWRAERAQKGRYREFVQCDVDVIGSESVTAEIEVIGAVQAAFAACGMQETPTAFLNDRGLLLGALKRAGVAQDKLSAACIALDKLDKAPEEKVQAELAALGGAGAWNLLKEGSLDDFSDVDSAAAARLKEILSTVNELAGRQAAVFSPSLVRGFDYYTSTVFEFKLSNVQGSLGGGGRYDRLTEKFGGQPVPACGGSIGFERLMLALEESKTDSPPGPTFCMTVFSPELRKASLEYAAKLRKKGHNVDVYPGAGKLGAQFKYADAKKARFALVIGPEESAAGRVKVKELATGQERVIDRDEELGLDSSGSIGHT